MNEDIRDSSIDKLEEVNDKLLELKEYYPQFFDRESNFKLEKFHEYLADNGIKTTTESFSLDFVGKEYGKLQTDIPTETFLAPLTQHNSSDINKDSQNIYLVGDNLDVLQHLRHSYTGKVGVIYIDPPYNTGSDDFTYVDKFGFTLEKLTEILGEEEKAERVLRLFGKSSHSAWLTFMLPRIVLGYKLLAEEGVMFISLDDNEAANMTLLCDEIFGEANRIGPIIQNKFNSKNDTKNIQKNHEYILVYRKQTIFKTDGSEEESLINYSTKRKRVYKEGDEYYYLNDYITTRGEGGTLKNRENLGFTIYYNKETKDLKTRADYNVDIIDTATSYEELYTDDQDLINQGYFPIRPPKVRRQFGAWTWEMAKVNTDKKYLIVTGTEPKYGVKKRTFVDSNDVFEENGKYYIETEIRGNSRSIIEYSTNAGTTHLNELMGVSGVFTNPKNVEMIMYLINLVPNKNTIVLDFFSGSGTTAEAVLRLNAIEEYNLKYILVQFPEELKEDNPAREEFGFETIDEVAQERIKRAALKIQEETGKTIDYGFRTYIAYKPDIVPLENIKDFHNTEDFAVQTTLGLSTERNIGDYSYKDATGKESLLTTWLIQDGFGFSNSIEKIMLNDYTVYKCDSRLYIIDEGMTSTHLSQLFSKIYQKELIITSVTIYVHSLSTEVLSEMDMGLKTASVRLIRRF